MGSPTIVVPLTSHLVDVRPPDGAVEPGRAGGQSSEGRPLSESRGRKGRPFFTDTAVGRLANERGLKTTEISIGAGINARTLSDYMSNRRRVTPTNAEKLARFFRVPAITFLEQHKEQS